MIHGDALTWKSLVGGENSGMVPDCVGGSLNCCTFCLLGEEARRALWTMSNLCSRPVESSLIFRAG